MNVNMRAKLRMNIGPRSFPLPLPLSSSLKAIILVSRPLFCCDPFYIVLLSIHFNK